MAPLNRELLDDTLLVGMEISTGKEKGELSALAMLLTLLLSSSLWLSSYNDPIVLSAVVMFPVKVLPLLEKLPRGLGVANATLGTSLVVVSALGSGSILPLRTRSNGIPVTEYLELTEGNATLTSFNDDSGRHLLSNVLNLVTAVTGMAGKLLLLLSLRLCP